jgi:hypothetical protein
MNKPIFSLLSCVLCACAAPIASAQNAPRAPIEITREAQQIALPNSLPRGDRSYKQGDPILTVPLVWEYGAILKDATTIRADGDIKDLPAGTVLQAMTLTETANSKQVAAYCTPRNAAERKADKGALGVLLGGGSVWRKVIRSETDRQYCLIDLDDDGIADQSVLINAGTHAARTPVATTPVHLDRQKMLPISDRDKMVIVLTEVSKDGLFANVRLDIIQQGEPRAFDTFGNTLRVTRLGAKKQGFPVKAEILGARFSIVALDGATRTATVNWPQDADPALAIAISDGLQVNIRFY